MHTILFVDDNTSMHTFIKYYIPIKLKHMKVLHAFNGNETIEIAQKNKNDISMIILDMLLPDMKGYDILLKLRKDTYFQKIPFIFQTALSENMINQQILAMENVHIIHKPYIYDLLIDKIKKILPNDENLDKSLDN